MPNFIIDYAQIKLIENIPLDNDDLTYIKQGCKAFKMSPVVPAFWVMILMCLLFWLVQDDYNKLKNSDYLLLAVIAFSVSIFTYFIFRFNKRSHLKNFEKDVQFGKCQLTSFVINSHEGELHENLIFAGPFGSDTVMLKVERSDFLKYEIGTKVIVTYLKHSREALFIEKYK